jgi:type IV pilus assembly protein PilA
MAEEHLWRILDAQQREHGPFTADQIRTGLSEGTIQREAHFWRDGMTAWAPLSAVARELGVVIVGSKVTEKKKGMSGCLIAAIVIGGGMLLVVPILAAIAISQYQDYVIRSQVAEGQAFADGVKTAVGEYIHNRQEMPPDNAAAGLAAPASISGAYVGEVAVVDGQIHAIYSAQSPQKANNAIDGQSLVFTPTVDGASIQWQCSSDTLKQKWCPSSCACQ